MILKFDEVLAAAGRNVEKIYEYISEIKGHLTILMNTDMDDLDKQRKIDELNEMLNMCEKKLNECSENVMDIYHKKEMRKYKRRKKTDAEFEKLDQRIM